MPNQYTSPRTDARFWSKVDPCRTDGCMIWVASLTTTAYGQFRFDGTTHKAHHFLAGIPPRGLEWDHLCRTPTCVEPSHLELVTHGENLARRPNTEGNRTHCPRGHAYTEANTFLREGKRRCKTCTRENARRWAHDHPDVIKMKNARRSK